MISEETPPLAEQARGIHTVDPGHLDIEEHDVLDSTGFDEAPAVGIHVHQDAHAVFVGIACDQRAELRPHLGFVIYDGNPQHAPSSPYRQTQSSG